MATLKIPINIVSHCYQVAKNIYESNKAIPLKDGIKELVSKSGMNASSATGYIRVFSKMIEGESFNRTLNADYFDYYLKHIFLDYGKSRLFTALSSLKKHIEYFEKIEGVNMLKVRQVYDNYFNIIPSFSKDEEEQEELVNILSQEQTREEIIFQLSNLQVKDPKTVIIKGRKYNRDNKTIAQIKILRKFQCQICGTSIIKKDGTQYIEAAHIKPKNEKGNEHPTNILILCPNHHKEFDYGDRFIKTHNENILEVVLNGATHKISLAIQ